MAAAPEPYDLWNGGSRLRVLWFPETRLSLALQNSSGFQRQTPLTPQRPCSVAADPAEAPLGGRVCRTQASESCPRG